MSGITPEERELIDRVQRRELTLAQAAALRGEKMATWYARMTYHMGGSFGIIRGRRKGVLNQPSERHTARNEVILNARRNGLALEAIAGLVHEQLGTLITRERVRQVLKEHVEKTGEQGLTGWLTKRGTTIRACPICGKVIARPDRMKTCSKACSKVRYERRVPPYLKCAELIWKARVEDRVSWLDAARSAGLTGKSATVVSQAARRLRSWCSRTGRDPAPAFYSDHEIYSRGQTRRKAEAVA